MSEDANILVQFRAEIEKRINEQYQRHISIVPNVDPRRVIEIQIKQEKERFERLYDQTEDPALADAYRVLIDEYLPDLEQKLKGRR